MTPNGARRTAHGAVSAIIVLAVVGPATGLEAHLPTGVLWCRHPRARAPVFSSQVDEAKSAAQIDEEWFPAGADEETLKKHFRKLAAREHPDVSTAPDAASEVACGAGSGGGASGGRRGGKQRCADGLRGCDARRDSGGQECHRAWGASPPADTCT